MPWIQCSRCHYIRESKRPAYELNLTNQTRSPALPKGAYCINCGAENLWQAYDGPLAPTILSKERQIYEETTAFYRQKEAIVASLIETRKNKQKEFDLNFTAKLSVMSEAEALNMLQTEIQLCFDVITSMTEELTALSRKLSEMTEPDLIERDARMVATNAAKNALGGLVLGNRQFVSALPPEKILDAANWSWGLNISWVEGGILGNADFELALNPNNPYHNIPSSIILILQGRPNISSEDFIELCREQGRGTLLWYDAEGDNRPTWTALEVATLLRMGYVFVFQSEKIYLRKAPSSASSSSFKAKKK
ncbi:hypothetical protein [Metapseudomonas otitidis]|uniref:hypothetical protein n=1 Tax=Metapseudomonas otitidis TaxID=319939 RepID=UPI00244D78BC|nr:hypothetical protein [Pseudomonas otitidis]MDG9780482.1 hypothetical protein [Pseudomonas otitidis]